MAYNLRCSAVARGWGVRRQDHDSTIGRPTPLASRNTAEPMNENLELRVVLLGRTGLDAALRHDASIELLRARTPLEAIGEITCGADLPDSPARAVVIVGPKVPGLTDGSEQQDSRVRQFIEAARLARPGVIVLAIANGVAPAGFDGVVDQHATPESIRTALLHHAWDSPLPGSAGATAKHESHPAAPSTPGAQPPPPALGRDQADTPLVSAMLRAQDILPVALALIRERTGDASVEFARTNEGVPVTWEQTEYGRLRAAHTGSDALRPHARWLAAWLRLRDQHTQLREAAFTDPLTGAWNRRYFDLFLATSLRQAREARRQVAVLLFDIDDFKKYNDLYGHAAGDEILRETVRLLRSVIRPTDRVCRVGGDEFAVIFDDPHGPRQEGSRQPTDVWAIARRFQQQVLNHRFPKLLELAPGTLTISGGLATFPWDGDTPEKLLQRADELALASKRQGKNAITMGPGALGMPGPE
jgi:two-component system cell cycle response regulator